MDQRVGLDDHQQLTPGWQPGQRDDVFADDNSLMSCALTASRETL
jgi:hypothetical protein